ncbi:phosphohydrolase [Leptolinea tardivitalis]|uniref:Phosphohydrolase n=1 Tax=Leptolinea tardivitalis TaxID=229920 RepID=A0A0P6WTF1_9CHLR|nr:phosphohydrolase [Leptolinea tardivitalis]
MTRDISERIRSEKALIEAHTHLEKAYDATLHGWARALEMREHETADHSRRVVEITERIAREMGLREEELLNIKRGALLHDIGKIGVPDNILLKPGPLTSDEWAIMRQHPEFAYRMLKDIDYLQSAIEIPYGHHERWDGSGYPRGLAGTDIPLAARIFSVVDVWDALLSDRPYRPAWDQKTVLNYLQEQSGKQFDPAVVEIIIRLLSDMN